MEKYDTFLPNTLTQIRTMPHVTLYQEKVAHLKCIVTATIDENGVLLVEGYDNGELVQRVWGDYDYEYSLKLNVSAVEKLKQQLTVHQDEDLLSQIQQQFGGATAFSQFKNFLDQQEIAYDYFSWI